jgi:hypothetical protein
MNSPWLIFAGVVVGLGAVALLYVISRPNESRPRTIAGWLSFGPFWPFVNRRIVQRGGLTERESRGWLFVLLLVFVAIVVSSVLKRA